MSKENEKTVQEVVDELQNRLEPLLKDDARSAVVVMVEYNGRRGGAKMLKKGCSHEMILASMIFEMGAQQFLSQILGKPVGSIESQPFKGQPFIKVLKEPPAGPQAPGVQ